MQGVSKIGSMHKTLRFLATIWSIVHLTSCSERIQDEIDTNKDDKEFTLVDSANFGEQTKFLVEFSKNSSQIQFYFKEKVGQKWNIIDSYHRESTEVLQPDIQFKDYDFDGYKDLSFNSDLGINGSNEMRTIILFKPNGNKIKVIEASPEFPNLRIDNKRKFLISTIFSGSTENIFFRFKNDTIEKIAMLEFDNSLVLKKYKNGKLISEKIIENISCDRYSRFSNYEPVTVEQ